MDEPVILDLKKRFKKKKSRGKDRIGILIFETNVSFQIQMEGQILLIISRAWIVA